MRCNFFNSLKSFYLSEVNNVVLYLIDGIHTLATEDMSPFYPVTFITKLKLLTSTFWYQVNPLSPELNPICYLLALLAHDFLHVSRIRVKSLTLMLLISYTYTYTYIYIYIYIYIYDIRSLRVNVQVTNINKIILQFYVCS
jgi:hypothetical protein